MTIALAVVALLVALGALALSVLTARQSGATASTLARHRYGHNLRDGVSDPGAARSARTGGRPEVPAYGPPTTAQPVVRPDDPEPAEEPDSPRLPRPGEIGRPR